jgi:kynureninase
VIHSPYSQEHADALDAADPLRGFRDEFHLPLHDGKPQAY